MVLLEWCPVEKWASEIERLIEEALSDRATDSTAATRTDEYNDALTLVKTAMEVGSAFTSRESKLRDIRAKISPRFRDEYDRVVDKAGGYTR